MKYFLIAGEASGDLHAANLMRSLKALDPDADFRYFGGDRMQEQGGILLKHYREMAFMGIIPVVMHLRTVLRNMSDCKKAIADYQPDAVVLIDYPGFNLQIAKYLKSGAVENPPKIIYYISPKIWAWKTYRIKAIKRYIDLMLSILPFEVNFYKKYEYSVAYVGNPTVDELAERDHADESFAEFVAVNHLKNKPIIALLAGSRKQEIRANLPAMIAAASSFPNYQLVIAGAPGLTENDYRKVLKDAPVQIVFGQTYRLLKQSQAALVTSGTATLETALLHVPQVVCYKMPFKYAVSFIFKHFFACRYISLVNLIADKPVVKELFGKDFSVHQIRHELAALLNDLAYRRTMRRGYNAVIARLGGVGASQKAAKIIIQTIKK
ncbi:MAG: lipid-A-disaccharide synthase [Candidatus Symbiothrix sp.]|jgi:lipid-A-disaccharide synthase|nr:lipid-A-disaccharide synthase [Candidatus Symbiothrix sp.]